MAKGSQKRASTAETDVPRWDLSGLFPSPDSDEFQRALADVASSAEKFKASYADKISGISAVDLAQAIESFEDIHSRIARIRSYAEMTAVADPRQRVWSEEIDEKLSAVEAKTIFFPVEINSISESDLIENMADRNLSAHARFLSSVRAKRPYMLKDDGEAPSAETEVYAFEKAAVGEDTWRKLYDLTVHDTYIKLGRKSCSFTSMEAAVRQAPSAERRHAAWAELSLALSGQEKMLTLVFNTMAGLHLANSRLREFEAVDSSSLVSSRLSTSTAEALTEAARSHQASISHRYFTWKAKKTGVARLHPADCHALLPEIQAGKLRGKISWAQAKKEVTNAFTTFSPEVGELAARFFEARHVSQAPASNKIYPADASGIPYAAIDFSGDVGGVLRLARLTAQVVHLSLSATQRKGAASVPSRALLETSGTLGAMLVFNAMIAGAATPLEERNLRVAGIESLLQESLLPAARLSFEEKLYEEREAKELTAGDLGRLWKKAQTEYYGSAINIDADGMNKMWALARDVIHDPYAAPVRIFGASLGMEIHENYVVTPDKKSFAERCIAILKAGGTVSESEVLSAFSIRKGESNDWKRGFRALRRHLDQLFALDEKTIGHSPVLAAVRKP